MTSRGSCLWLRAGGGGGKQAGSWLGGGSDDSGPMAMRVVVVVSIYGENGGSGCSGFARSLSGPFVPCLRGSSFVRSQFGRGVQLVDWQRTREWKVGGGSRVSMRAGVAKLPKASVNALNLVTTTT